MKKNVLCINMIVFALIFCSPVILNAIQTADDLVEMATKDQKDIAVYFHGSDWCVSGERLLKSLWNSPSFQNSFSKYAIAASTDMREDQNKLDIEATSKIASQQTKGVALKVSPPIATSGADFSVLPNHTFLVTGNNPKSDRYTFSFRTEENIKNPIFRFSFLKDPSLPNNGPGRGQNGRFALSRLAIQSLDLKPLKMSAILGNQNHRNHPVSELFSDKKGPKTFWGVEPNEDTPCLFVTLDDELEANKEYEIYFYFDSEWQNSSIGKFQVTLFDDELTHKKMEDCFAYYQQATAMAPFRNGINDGFPLIVMYDTSKRQLGSIICLDEEMKEDQILQKMEIISSARKTRDRHFKRALEQTGSDKAASLAQGLLAFDDILPYHQIRSIYKREWDEIKKLDPEDASGFQRKLDLPFNALVGEIRKLVKESRYDQAEEVYNKALLPSKNFRLSPEQRQQMTFAGFYLYKNWKERKDQVWDVLKKTIAIAPNTHIGLGARGYMSMHGKGEVMIPHGLFPKDFETGNSNFVITEGLSNIINHAGDYQFEMVFEKGKSTFEVCKITLTINGQPIFNDDLLKTLNSSTSRATIKFSLKEKPAKNAKLELKIQGRTLNGSDCRIEFSLRPTLD